MADRTTSFGSFPSLSPIITLSHSPCASLDVDILGFLDKPSSTPSQDLSSLCGVTAVVSPANTSLSTAKSGYLERDLLANPIHVSPSNSLLIGDPSSPHRSPDRNPPATREVLSIDRHNVLNECRKRKDPPEVVEYWMPAAAWQDERELPLQGFSPSAARACRTEEQQFVTGYDRPEPVHVVPKLQRVTLNAELIKKLKAVRPFNFDPLLGQEYRAREVQLYLNLLGKDKRNELGFCNKCPRRLERPGDKQCPQHKRLDQTRRALTRYNNATGQSLRYKETR